MFIDTIETKMASPITKETIQHLAKLARLELTPNEEKQMLADLSKILAYFDELQTLDTSRVRPMTGGTTLKNVFREDTAAGETNRGAGVNAFPESKDGFLKIPPVFSAEGGSLPGRQAGASGEETT